MTRSIHSNGLFIAVIVLSAVLLTWGATAQTTSPVTVGYGVSVPASCPAGFPALFVQHGSTGLVAINACTSGKYQQIWQAERFADAETPSGAVNGTNSLFSLAHSPNPARSLQLVKNGTMQRQGVDYTLNGHTHNYDDGSGSAV